MERIEAKGKKRKLCMTTINNLNFNDMNNTKTQDKKIDELRGRISSIQISDETKNKLKELSYKDQTYEDIINELITLNLKFTNEKTFNEWFSKNYELFGFDRILQTNYKSTPDYIMNKDGKEIKVEIETLASNYILHGHRKKDVDLVICLKNDKKIEVPVIEIKNFLYTPEGRTMFGIYYLDSEKQIINNFKKHCIDLHISKRKALLVLMKKFCKYRRLSKRERK